MCTNGPEIQQGLRGPGRELRSLIPEVYAGFAQTHKAALADGVLSGFTKELIAFGIAIHSQCDGCLASHGRALAEQGASVEQVADAIGVAILMGGGPATVYGPRALAIFKSFQSE